MGLPKKTTAERFLERVDNAGDCWVWTGGKAGDGYGQFSVGGKRVYAHRFSWEENNGPVPDGMLVCHSCGNNSCVNPEHLWVGTHGDSISRRTPEERFWNKVDRGDAADCWPWNGARLSNGYGYFGVDGKMVLTHRFSYELKKGSIDDGLFVCHSCDVPFCVNPDHLWLGTHQDNMDDMLKKGRRRNVCGGFGENHVMAKLTDVLVKKIRLEYPEKTMAQLARDYGVSHSVISGVVKRRSWKHV